MPTDDLDVDAIVEECRLQSSLPSGVGIMFRSLTQLAEEVKRLRVNIERWAVEDPLFKVGDTGRETIFRLAETKPWPDAVAKQREEE